MVFILQLSIKFNLSRLVNIKRCLLVSVWLVNFQRRLFVSVWLVNFQRRLFVSVWLVNFQRRLFVSVWLVNFQRCLFVSACVPTFTILQQPTNFHKTCYHNVIRGCLNMNILNHLKLLTKTRD